MTNLCATCIAPLGKLIFIKNNNWYYKPHSLAAGGVGGYSNRGLLRYKKRRT